MRTALRTIITLCLCLVLTPIAGASADARGEAQPKPVMEAALHETPATRVPPPIVATGMPVPRWVSVKAERVNVRRGPSFDQQVLWTYVKPGLPVEVIAEYDTWRRIRDVNGDTGWVKGSLLDGRRTVTVQGRVNTALLGAPKADADVVAYAEPGLVARLVSCQGEWCEVSTRGYDGFVSRDRLWGVYADETVR
jgi:SH3-like domain-containing protein